MYLLKREVCSQTALSALIICQVRKLNTINWALFGKKYILVIAVQSVSCTDTLCCETALYYIETGGMFACVYVTVNGICMSLINTEEELFCRYFHWTVIGTNVLYKSYHTLTLMNQLEKLGLQLCWTLWGRPSLIKTSMCYINKTNSCFVAPCALFNLFISRSSLFFLLSSPHSLQRNNFKEWDAVMQWKGNTKTQPKLNLSVFCVCLMRKKKSQFF